MEDLKDKTDPPAVAEENGTPDGDGVVVDLASRRKIIKGLKLVKPWNEPSKPDPNQMGDEVKRLKGRLDELFVEGKIPGDKPGQR